MISAKIEMRQPAGRMDSVFISVAAVQPPIFHSRCTMPRPRVWTKSKSRRSALVAFISPSAVLLGAGRAPIRSDFAVFVQSVLARHADVQPGRDSRRVPRWRLSAGELFPATARPARSCCCRSKGCSPAI